MVVESWEPVVAMVLDRAHVVAFGGQGGGVGPGCAEGGGAEDVVDVVGGELVGLDYLSLNQWRIR